MLRSQILKARKKIAHVSETGPKRRKLAIVNRFIGAELRSSIRGRFRVVSDWKVIFLRALKSFLGFLLVVSSTGCTLSSTKISPVIVIKPIKSDLAKAPSAFDPLTLTELESDWAKEFLIGQKFAKDLDLYRAITAFKRALFMMPKNLERRFEIEYSIIESYYLAAKYCDVIQEFEASQLSKVSSQFPAFRNLLIIMQDSYGKVKEYDKSDQLLKFIQQGDAELANDLQLSAAIVEGDIFKARQFAADSKKKVPVNDFIDEYCQCALSPKKAQILNAVFPGAGYYYVGQKHAAMTSFVLNSLFIGATYYFFEKGNWPAGLITLSLETGWYVGGINGAGLEAKEYNEMHYSNMGKGMMIRNDLFPLLMLETSF